MNECTKAAERRKHDRRFAERYFVGHGIDVGAGSDSLGSLTHLFPLMKSCRTWDIANGDAMILATVAYESLDFLHSSHCLEHLDDPSTALFNWARVVRPGGHLVIIVPDEDLYEQGVWPSSYNADHKTTFTIGKSGSWSPRTCNLVELAAVVSLSLQLLKIETLDATYRYNQPRQDQTLGPGESAIEMVLRKWTAQDIARGGRLPE